MQHIEISKLQTFCMYLHMDPMVLVSVLHQKQGLFKCEQMLPTLSPEMLYFI
jgi:hypothetical protein